ncbi:uncharacterized protein LOC126885930 [Diabrotica virgifera virgifera]|uniref:Uncharacterized protein LOC114330994 n=1 Tax=Diabrotica virgifera virgifera TaxID=50390 RepID=A0A6P7FJT7_DIAVI|nr:uncharacterized protein LOC126885930 [Diabrotica virgifera virgifera]
MDIKSCVWIFLLFSVKFCSSLDCYTCSTQLNLEGDIQNKCDVHSWFSNKTPNVSFCQSPNVCSKYIVEHDGIRWVHRSCSPNNICSQVAGRYNDNRNALVECQTCSDQDLCNSAHRSVFGQVLLLIVIFIIF